MNVNDLNFQVNIALISKKPIYGPFLFKTQS